MNILATIIRGLIIVIALGYLFVGFAGFARPSGLAEAMALAPQAPSGIAAMRTLVGAHFAAMGVIALIAAVRIIPAWLVPLAAIEGFMILARVIALINGEADAAGLTQTGMEIVACAVLTLGAVLPIRAFKTTP